MKRPVQLDPVLTRLIREHQLTLPKPRDTWRSLKETPTGEVLGLGKVFRGQAIATNGIIVAILTSNNDVVYGHFDWFITDDNEPTLEQAAADVITNKKDKSLKEYADFF